MKIKLRNVIILLILSILMLSLGCSRHYTPNTEPEKGSIPISMNLNPAINNGFRIDQVSVRITRGSFTQEMNLTIDGSVAEGVFEDLDFGTYAIDAFVYDAGTLIATGQGSGTVLPAQTTTVYLTLQFIPGALEVHISWGLPYEECRRILLVGNSHTYFNSGVDMHLQNLINSAHPEWQAVVSSSTVGGYTLENHLSDQNTLSAINFGDWDLVILQEQSSRPMTDPDLFYGAAIALQDIISRAGSLTGFYMTWAWRNNPEMYEPIRDAYSYIGAYLDALVVPVGVGFFNANQLDPPPDLYNADNYHPGPLGTYLASCMMLASIWNINPIGNSYIPTGIDAATGLMIQELAWDTVTVYHNPARYSREDIAKPLWDLPQKAFGDLSPASEPIAA